MTYTTMEDTFYSSVCRYELRENNTVIRTENEMLNVKIYKENDIISMIKGAGFHHVRLIKAFDRNAEPEAMDESIVYECIK